MQIEEFLAIKKQYEDAIKTEGCKLFADLLLVFFDTHPEVTKIGWTQYTPYFNDGDACYFRVGNFGFCPAGQETEFDRSIYDYSSYGFRDNSNLQKACQTFERSVQKLGDDVFLSIFGDHAKVIAKYDPENLDVIFSVDTYEHD